MDRYAWRDVVVGWLVLLLLFGAVILTPVRHTEPDRALFLELPEPPSSAPAGDEDREACTERAFAQELC